MKPHHSARVRYVKFRERFNRGVDKRAYLISTPRPICPFKRSFHLTIVTAVTANKSHLGRTPVRIGRLTTPVAVFIVDTSRERSTTPERIRSRRAVVRCGYTSIYVNPSTWWSYPMKNRRSSMYVVIFRGRRRGEL